MMRSTPAAIPSKEISPQTTSRPVMLGETKKSQSRLSISAPKPKDWIDVCQETWYINLIPGVLTAVPTALNAAAAATNTAPKELLSKLATMSAEEIFYTLRNGGLSFGVNMFVGTNFFWDSLRDLRTSFFDLEAIQKNGYTYMGMNIVAVIFGLAAAIPFAVMAAEGGSAISVSFAVLSAVTNLVAGFTSRQKSAKNFFELVASLLNENVQFTRECASLLDRINDKYRFDADIQIRFAFYRCALAEANMPEDEINALERNNYINPDKDDEVEEILSRALKDYENNKYTATITYQALKNLNNLAKKYKDFIREKNNTDITKEYGCMLFDVMFAVFIAASAFPVFMEKGFQGLNNWKTFEDCSTGTKIAVGAPSGLASAILYAMSALKFRETLWQAMCSCYEDPISFFKLIPLLLANYYASTSVEGVATLAFKNQDRILQSWGLSATESEWMRVLTLVDIETARVGAGVVNSAACIRETKALNALKNRPGLNGFKTSLQKRGLKDALTHSYDSKTAAGIINRRVELCGLFPKFSPTASPSYGSFDKSIPLDELKSKYSPPKQSPKPAASPPPQSQYTGEETKNSSPTRASSLRKPTKDRAPTRTVAFKFDGERSQSAPSRAAPPADGIRKTQAPAKQVGYGTF